ncbi:bifunctional glycosyltransferase family 2/GtrA family protein [Demequina gelatinilytica]|uniref:bifunctional glycosyltransferase family 2/GtrA family protein n=1 Tax=Demequina gelatinilytica TaxID=1638980 RepID=UPI0007817E1D|nr:bifunctional glycosyltransferase family 2/GtrA family protein [Demequina gelatinilytica]
MWVLIAAYEPGPRLVELVDALRPRHRVLVVDDGSGQAFAAVFAAAAHAGAHVLAHDANQGKAAALRTGMAWLHRHHPTEALVCADSDGQHRPDDIEAVARVLADREASGLQPALVLGARGFDGEVPLRSRVGNRTVSAATAMVTGLRLDDTQTGLRGYPAALVPWAIGVHGERFAYEMRVLLEASRAGIPVVEVRIGTVYLDGNVGSHFRPVADSLRVLAPVAVFAASSLGAFALDTAVLLALADLTGSLAVAVVGARLLSGSVNFLINRRAVFASRDSVAREASRYLALALALVGASYVSLTLLTALGTPLLLAKVTTDVGLWALSFGIQRAVVFGRRAPSARRTALVSTSTAKPMPK